MSDRALGPAFNARQAAAYLGFEDSRWLDDAPIPWVDLRKPGASRPSRRWLRADLDAWLASRRVEPGFPSPFR